MSLGIQTSDEHLAASGAAKTQQSFGRGGLARTIGTEQDGCVPKIHGETDTANGHRLSEADFDVADFYGMTHVGELSHYEPLS
jgi:hypothetical protein